MPDALPILENMGLRVLIENGPYTVQTRDGTAFFVHDFAMETPTEKLVDIDAVRADFEQAFKVIWDGELENDGFNRLVLKAGLPARALAVLRAYCKYMLQIGRPFSQRYIEASLTTNPKLSKLLVELFGIRFNPSLAVDRQAKSEEKEQEIEAALENVASLDEDRIIRLYLGLIKATLRTNAYQQDSQGKAKSYLSFKFNPRLVPNMPLPRPQFEIFVYAPSFEGVHLRGG